MMDGTLEVAWRSRTGIASEGAVAKPGNAEELPPPNLRFADIPEGDMFAYRRSDGEIAFLIKRLTYGGHQVFPNAVGVDGSSGDFPAFHPVYRVNASLNCTIIKPDAQA